MNKDEQSVKYNYYRIIYNHGEIFKKKKIIIIISSTKWMKNSHINKKKKKNSNQKNISIPYYNFHGCKITDESNNPRIYIQLFALPH